MDLLLAKPVLPWEHVPDESEVFLSLGLPDTDSPSEDGQWPLFTEWPPLIVHLDAPLALEFARAAATMDIAGVAAAEPLPPALPEPPPQEDLPQPTAAWEPQGLLHGLVVEPTGGASAAEPATDGATLGAVVKPTPTCRRATAAVGRSAASPTTPIAKTGRLRVCTAPHCTYESTRKGTS